MAPTQKVYVKNTTYNVTVLTGEMDTTYNQILDKQSQITTLRDHLTSANQELTDLNNQFIIQYIQVTGQFPPTV